MYALIKRFLFLFQPETAHHLTFFLLRLPGAAALFGAMYRKPHPGLQKNVFGLDFPGPVGLAAGLDKNALAFEAFGKLGFDFIEVGTLTPKAQPGNEKPRLFRLLKDHALINRMGFNNDGVEAAKLRLAKRKNNSLIIGGNIGKNKNTPNETALEDYVMCFNALYEVVDYFVVNVSSPNTPGLRALQEKEPLLQLLNTIQQLNQSKPKTKPVLLKIAPDLSNEQLDDIIDIVNQTKIAGVIATNTSISRAGLLTPEAELNSIGAGGLSGKPLRERSTEVIAYLKQKSNHTFPVIGVGGIHSAEDALEKLKAGADLIQLYTGFIYEGPKLIKDIHTRLLAEHA
ncbi:MAG: quinone-dependent dihydroorotate dehydrogenase [Bacteroidia bacterium]|jgi:dihydroorotate dehydrogenase|nr:quinone-dependent dihydroorotate dehydrogenase [Bacteroidia bacterium]